MNVARWIALGLAIGAPQEAPPTPGVFLGDLTWPEAEERLRQAPLVVLPFGAGAKEHGPHLPLNADEKFMDHLCREAVRALQVVVAPPILHGWLPAFREFPGTEVADPEVFRRYAQEVALSLVRHGAKRIVFLNTGVSRASGLPLAIAAREIRAEKGVPTLVVSADDLETPEHAAMVEQRRGSHADEIETSIHLVLQPRLVRMEKAVADLGRERAPLSGYRPGYFSRDPRDPSHSETGVFGDPTKASVEKGRRFLAARTAEWRRTLEAFSAEPVRSR